MSSADNDIPKKLLANTNTDTYTEILTMNVSGISVEK